MSEEATNKPTLPDLVVDYIERMPANLGSVSSHFGMTPSEVQPVLLELERAGRIRMGRYYHWEVAA